MDNKVKSSDNLFPHFSTIPTTSSSPSTVQLGSSTTEKTSAPPSVPVTSLEDRDVELESAQHETKGEVELSLQERKIELGRENKEEPDDPINLGDFNIGRDDQNEDEDKKGEGAEGGFVHIHIPREQKKEEDRPDVPPRVIAPILARDTPTPIGPNLRNAIAAVGGGCIGGMVSLDQKNSEAWGILGMTIGIIGGYLVAKVVAKGIGHIQDAKAISAERKVVDDNELEPIEQLERIVQLASSLSLSKEGINSRIQKILDLRQQYPALISGQDAANAIARLGAGSNTLVVEKIIAAINTLQTKGLITFAQCAHSLTLCALLTKDTSAQVFIDALRNLYNRSNGALTVEQRNAALLSLLHNKTFISDPETARLVVELIVETTANQAAPSQEQIDHLIRCFTGIGTCSAQIMRWGIARILQSSEQIETDQPVRLKMRNIASLATAAGANLDSEALQSVLSSIVGQIPPGDPAAVRPYREEALATIASLGHNLGRHLNADRMQQFITIISHAPLNALAPEQRAQAMAQLISPNMSSDALVLAYRHILELLPEGGARQQALIAIAQTGLHFNHRSFGEGEFPAEPSEINIRVTALLRLTEFSRDIDRPLAMAQTLGTMGSSLTAQHIRLAVQMITAANPDPLQRARALLQFSYALGNSSGTPAGVLLNGILDPQQVSDLITEIAALASDELNQDRAIVITQLLQLPQQSMTKNLLRQAVNTIRALPEYAFPIAELRFSLAAAQDRKDRKAQQEIERELNAKIIDLSVIIQDAVASVTLFLAREDERSAASQEQKQVMDRLQPTGIRQHIQARVQGTEEYLRSQIREELRAEGVSEGEIETQVAAIINNLRQGAPTAPLRHSWLTDQLFAELGSLASVPVDLPRFNTEVELDHKDSEGDLEAKSEDRKQSGPRQDSIPPPPQAIESKAEDGKGEVVIDIRPLVAPVPGPRFTPMAPVRLSIDGKFADATFIGEGPSADKVIVQVTDGVVRSNLQRLPGVRSAGGGGKYEVSLSLVSGPAEEV